MAARTHISVLVAIALAVAASTASAMIVPGRIDSPADRNDLARAVRDPQSTEPPPTTNVGSTTTSPTTVIGRPTAIISLGDSYISGEAGRWAGNSNSTVGDRDGTDRAYIAPGPADPEIVYSGTVDNGCNRSDVAPIRSTSITVDATFNIACSAAQTEHVIDTTFKGEPPQSQQLQQLATDYDIKMIVLSIGGNDLRFSQILANCARKFSPAPGPSKDLCSDEEQPQVDADMPGAMAGVDTAVRTIRASMAAAGSSPGDYRLVLVSYPSPIPRAAEIRFPEVGASRVDDGRCPAYDEDATWARDSLVPQISDELRIVATANAVEFLDLRDAFDGNEACSVTSDRPPVGGPPDPATAEWSRWFDLANQGDSAERAHPNAYGQQAYGRCFELVWDSAPAGAWTCTNTPGEGPDAMVLAAL